MNPENQLRLAARTELLLMDVDGVLTDGKILFVPLSDGSVGEAKAFHSTDGSGIGLARRAGMKLGVISGRSGPALLRRAEELRLDYVYHGLGSRKLHAFEEIVVKSGTLPERICYVGDDVQDLPILRRVGFSVAVANACAEVKRNAALVTAAAGGNGAIREVVEFILRAQGKWDALVSEFLT